MNDENYHQVPQHILEMLSSYQQHKNCTCTSCGYSGAMGIDKEETSKKKKSWITKFLISLVIYSFTINFYYPSGRNSYVPFLLGFPAALIFMLLIPPNFETAICPNCGVQQKN